MMKDLVSIIIAVYNAQEYLGECLDTLLAQTHKNIEIILVDDGSTDDSYKICCEYTSRYSNIQVYQKRNEGSASARNLGLEHAKGDYIIFVDADDTVTVDYIEKLYNAIQGYDVAICGFDRFNEEGIQTKKILEASGEVSKEFVYEHTFSSNMITGAAWNKLFRGDIIRANNLKYSREIFKSEDTLFAAEYYVYCNKYVYIPENLYHYRMNPQSKTQEAYVIKKYNPKKNTMIDVGERIVSINVNSNDAIKNVAFYRLVRCCLWVMMQWIITGYYDKEYAKKIRSYSAKHGKVYRGFSYATTFQRLVVMGMSISPRLVWLAGKMVYNLKPDLIKSKEM